MQARVFGCTAFAVLLAATLGGCKNKADLDEIPEVAEVKTKPAELKVDDNKVELKPAEISLEEKFPLRKSDVGKTFYVAGTVIGTPGPQGFFLRTEGNQIVFVNSTTALLPGQAARAVGTLNQATTAVFKGWKKEMLGHDVKAEWKLHELWYLEASAVQPL
ncbi:MAG: hypothetical protein ACREMA_12880 [Longimicrobiales bacterium]